MQGIAEMKAYSPRDLANLLSLCAESLAMAYQELSDRDLNRLSFEAYCASDYLNYIAAGQQANHQVH